MKLIKSSSSSPGTNDRLVRLPLELLSSHPLNANEMAEEGWRNWPATSKAEGGQ